MRHGSGGFRPSSARSVATAANPAPVEGGRLRANPAPDVCVRYAAAPHSCRSQPARAFCENGLRGPIVLLQRFGTMPRDDRINRVRRELQTRFVYAVVDPTTEGDQSRQVCLLRGLAENDLDGFTSYRRARNQNSDTTR